MNKTLNYNFVIVFSIIVLALTVIPAHAQQTSIDNGLFYLYSTQNFDGSWGGTETSLNTTLQTTAITARTLQILGITDISLNNALTYLSSQSPNNIDDLSRQIEVLSVSHIDVISLVSSIKSAQQTDGGLGIDLEKEYQSDNIDTISAIDALNGAGRD